MSGWAESMFYATGVWVTEGSPEGRSVGEGQGT